jgi:hypothetical protein
VRRVVPHRPALRLAAPKLHAVLAEAKIAQQTVVDIDGTFIPIDRLAAGWPS